MAAARRGLFYGVWLGGMFGMFRNHVASLKEQAQLAAEEERLAQVRGRSRKVSTFAGVLLLHSKRSFVSPTFEQGG